jgi:hypothetical protein
VKLSGTVFIPTMKQMADELKSTFAHDSTALFGPDGPDWHTVLDVFASNTAFKSFLSVAVSKGDDFVKLFHE